MSDQKPHTHYDNLMVTRNAPAVVIRAAYKALSQIHHPDNNLGNAGALKTMEIITVAYAVLSDPVKKEKYDRWLSEQSQKTEKAQSNVNNDSDSCSDQFEQAHPGTYSSNQSSSEEYTKKSFESDDELSPEQAEQLKRKIEPRYHYINQAQSRVLVMFVGFLFRLLAMGTFMAVVILAVVSAANSL